MIEDFGTLLEGTILRIEEQDGEKTGVFDHHGVRIPVNLNLLPDVDVGQKVLVYRGVALSIIREVPDEVCR